MTDIYIYICAHIHIHVCIYVLSALFIMTVDGND